MFGFLFKWIFRGAVLAGVAAALHACGATHIYADDDDFNATPTARHGQP